MFTRSRLGTIRDRIRLLGAVDRTRQNFGAAVHGYALAPGLDGDGISTVEGALGTQLPDEVRAFLGEVGSAGAGPYYGLLALAAPVEDGMVAVAEQGCGMRSFLVLDGAARGEIWTDATDDGSRAREAVGILAWYERWIDAAIDEWAQREARRFALDGVTSADELEAIDLAFERASGRTLGYLHLRERRYTEAETAFRAAAAAGGEESEARLALDLACAAVVRGDHHGAIAYVERGVGADDLWWSTKDELRGIHERALHALGRHDDALAILDARAAEHMNDLAIHHRLAREHLARNELERAMSVLERAARFPNIIEPGATIERRMSAAFDPVAAELRAGGRGGDAGALAARVELILGAN